MIVQSANSSVNWNLYHAQSVMGGIRCESYFETTYRVRPFSRVLYASFMLSFDVRAMLLVDGGEKADTVMAESQVESRSSEQ